ncbi:MAG: FHA domain-containing protein [Chloracidobacterium sp.]|nr:FHA domain-containing protein [Chloracidobacterium sp.]
MLICPTCRNQNLDTAKFCGNCGNSFTRPSASTSSLINCAQGHVYSAVYEHCPYCPQPQYESLDSDFATRLETPITEIDQTRGSSPTAYTNLQNTSDFATRIDTRENVFETIESPTLPPPSSAPLAPAPVFVPTEIRPAIPPSEFGSAPADSFRLSGTLESTVLNQESRTSPTLAPQAVSSSIDRRTIMLSDQSTPRKSKGRIVGWLITYSNNPDGDDFRIYAGYNRIGANPVCDVQIEDETVSGSHAIIVYRDGRCLIKDDLSRNGTFVNGKEITEAQPLQCYDQVRVGNTTLTFVEAQRVE